MSKILIIPFMALCLGYSSMPVLGADIRPIGNNIDGTPVVTISGEFVPRDVERFADATRELETATIAFNSPGGDLVAGIEIGTRIRLLGYSTIVADHQECFSACALAWLGGSTRFVGRQADIGFHAAYLEKGGRRLETGVGNALVGAYASRLGLRDAAVIFITSAPPEGYSRLTEDGAQRVGIAAEFGESDEVLALRSPPSISARTLELEWKKPYSRWAMGWLGSFYNKDFVQLTGSNIDWNEPPFDIATVDLRDDKTEPENSAILVKWNDSDYCSSDGCVIDIWVSKAYEYHKSGPFLGKTVLLEDAYALGYRNIWIDNSIFRWDGQKYVADDGEQTLVTVRPHPIAEADVPNTSEQLEWAQPSSTWERAWIAKFYSERLADGSNIDWNTPPLKIATVELKEDKLEPESPAIFVYLEICGSGGCQIDVWISQKGEYRQVGGFLGYNLTLGKSYSLGYRDLWLQDTLFRWDGESYQRP